MYSWKNIALFINVALILSVSIIYFDAIKVFSKYDSYIHFSMYFTLGLLSIDLNSKRRVSYRFIFIIFIPIIAEYIQDFIPSRRYDLEDAYYSYLGLLSGLTIYLVYTYVKKA